MKVIPHNKQLNRAQWNWENSMINITHFMKNRTFEGLKMANFYDDQN
jgi:hypothetical protein